MTAQRFSPFVQWLQERGKGKRTTQRVSVEMTTATVNCMSYDKDSNGNKH